MTEKRAWIYDFLFILVLLVAAALRLTGVNWGEGYHQHPDELFLSGVLENLRAHTCIDPKIPIDACPESQQRWLTLGEVFDGAKSTLNPYNRGNATYVYGDLPLFIVRYAAELTHTTDLAELKFFSRQFSALADLFSIFFLYLFASRMYGRRVGVLAALFSSLAVMQIQQSHFFTVDLFVNMFMFLAIWFAVEIVMWKEKEKQVTRSELGEMSIDLKAEGDDVKETRKESQASVTHYFALVTHPLFLLSIAFGVSLGMAMASKINAAVLALLLPAAFGVRYLSTDHRPRTTDNNLVGGQWSVVDNYWLQIVAFLIAGGLATIISFRIFQPYAFQGLFSLNPQWIANIQEQRTQATGEADLPWNLQWARRSHLYSFENLTVWGLGLPLGILAWIGFLLMGWRILRGEWRHLLLWGWTAFYFGWQSLQFNPTMRYQLPVYPLLAMMAAWVIIEGPKFKKTSDDGQRTMVSRPWSIVAGIAGIIVVVLTAGWAFAFQSIYLRPEPRMAASRWIYANVPGPINLQISTNEDGVSSYSQPLPFPLGASIQAGTPYPTNFVPESDGTLTGITFAHALEASASPASVNLSLVSTADPNTVLARASAVVDAAASKDPRGPTVSFTFDRPVPVKKDVLYSLTIETLGENLTLTGAAIANETDYDWSLPFRVDGFDAFGGLYRGDLIFQVYWDDNPDKLTRFMDVLSQTDYIFIPTNHQYGQITRVPERYPLTTLYYRELIGCPPQQEIIECYRLAKPGQYKGNLGFDLVAVFEDYPTFGPVVINDQRAEEAFTFYDHPKVLIFKKSENFDADKVRAILGSVDTTQAVHLLPRQFSSYKDLMLPLTRLTQERAGGTWSQLFNYEWIQNKYPFVGLIVWYVFIFLLGLVVYPIVRLAFPGLGLYGYPISRALGLLLLAWISWMAGSFGVPYTRVTIGAALGLIVAAGLSLGWMRRDQLKEEWQTHRRFFLFAEGIFVSFFLFDLLIRLGNSDLWHPSKGGERPMDFSYFNAILKSTSFPPYDPWFAGGYINYYYYGFVLVGTPVKLLGIVPSIAYNFILPTLFAMVAAGAFTVGWNLLDGGPQTTDHGGQSSIVDGRLVAGLAAATLMILIGNLGTVQMVFQAFQRMAAPGGVITGATIIQRWAWALKGFAMSFGNMPLPIGQGEWYWDPSRVMPPGPGNEITEFPLFTFLYSDLHAHMIVLPVTLLIMAWTVSFLKARARMNAAEWVAAFLIGGLAIGALKPMNTWDLYTYFPLAALAMIYTILRHFEWNGRFGLSEWLGRALFAIGSAILLYALGAIFYAPFTHWFSQAYNSINFWIGPYTPFWSYLTHWGLFLFIIVSWMTWETREWMAATPVSALNKLRPYMIVIELGLALILALLLFFAIEGISIGWLALPLAAWAAVLMLRPGQPGVKRGVLLMIGTALTLTLAVEKIALAGDIGRMNTVFKLYIQAWSLLAVSSAAALGWLLYAFPQWLPRWRNTFQVGLSFLLIGVFMFTVTATTDKVKDRMAPNAPHTLDSMTYMDYAQFFDGGNMDLSEDYRAIRWMQDNVQGSPVIVEANCSEYRWCTRFTIYTGLPGVVGWNWHQRQQRVFASTTVENRVLEIGSFYTTPDINAARDFLKKYQVKYIIVGQLEHNLYPPVDGVDGLAKFEQYNGKYWHSVYHDGNTVIYEVMP